MNTLARALAALLLTATAAAAALPEADRLGGRLEATVDGRTVVFPTLRTEIEAEVLGDLATVTVVQTFVNPGDDPMHATYLFPLNRDAAVFAMTMEVGDEIVRAVIERSEEAKKTFTKAKKAGKAASLLVQHRPNMFTQNVANLMPGLPIRVTLRYVQTVPKMDGDHELVIPLVVGPRYQPTGAGVPGAKPSLSDGEAGDGHVPAPERGLGGHRRSAAGRAAKHRTGPPSRWAGEVPRWDLSDPPSVAGGAAGAESKHAFGAWEVEALPAYPPVKGLDIPEEIDPARVSITVHLDAGMPIRRIGSRTHELTIARLEPSRARAVLAGGRTIDNRDFVLRYGLGGESNQAGLLAWRDRRGGFFSLLIEPPDVPADEQISAREMVFVLDCSGSMNGVPIEASKAFMRKALRNLRPSDTFRIIRFSDAASEMTSRPLPATPANVAGALRYTDGLRGSGGTRMTSGIEQALLPPVPDGAIRIVTFLTDGYIGNEHDVLRLIDERIGDARLFAFGVGTSVNRYLLSEMGRVGRGFTRFMDPTEDVDEVSGELAERLQSPVLTDIEIDWGDIDAFEVSPDPVPDLFAGGSIRIQGRYEEPGVYEVTVRGKVAGRPATLPLRVELPETGERGEAIPLVWARSAIREAMRKISSPERFRNQSGEDALLDENALKERVIQLGLDFSLVTQWTSFVAVSEKVYNDRPEDAEDRPVPLSQVKGVSHLAYGKPGTAANPRTVMVAQATPEPATILGFLLVALVLAALLVSERRAASVSVE